MLREILQESIYIQLWVLWMALVNLTSVLFLGHVGGIVVLLAVIGNLITISWLYSHFGFVKLLGLSHVIWWTPLVVFLLCQFKSIPASEKLYQNWVIILLLTNSASLIIDYLDVYKYFANR